MGRSTVRTALLTLGLAGLAVAGAAGLVVAGGLFDVSAARPHTQLVYSLLEATKRNAVRRLAKGVPDRPLDDPALVQRGGVCFHAHCLACHGAPGVPPEPAARAMQPLPGPLQDTARRWRTGELVWIMRNGIRMSGMPAWAGRLPDDDIWAVAAYLRWLPTVSPAAHRLALQAPNTASCPVVDGEQAEPPRPAWLANAERGREALQRHACHGCHQVPGVTGSQRDVGPPLAGLGRRQWIAGALVNTPENLAAWIRDPQRFKPHSAMPAMGVSHNDAQAMAAYLGSLH